MHSDKKISSLDFWLQEYDRLTQMFTSAVTDRSLQNSKNLDNFGFLYSQASK
jgi:hypothetical protein